MSDTDYTEQAETLLAQWRADNWDEPGVPRLAERIAAALAAARAEGQKEEREKHGITEACLKSLETTLDYIMSCQDDRTKNPGDELLDTRIDRDRFVARAEQAEQACARLADENARLRKAITRRIAQAEKTMKADDVYPAYRKAARNRRDVLRWVLEDAALAGEPPTTPGEEADRGL